MAGQQDMLHGGCADFRCIARQSLLPTSCCLVAPAEVRFVPFVLWSTAWIPRSRSRGKVGAKEPGLAKELVVYSRNQLAARSRAIRLCAQEYAGGILSQMKLEVMILKKKVQPTRMSTSRFENYLHLYRIFVRFRDEEAEDHADRRPNEDDENLEFSPGRGSAEVQVFQAALRRSAEGEVPQQASKLHRTDRVNHVSEAKRKYFYDDFGVVVDEDVDLLESWEFDEVTSDLLELDELSRTK